MRKFLSPLLVVGALALAACVNINIYFPAAEAQQAAEEFVDKVIGDDGAPAEAAPAKPPQAWQAPRFNPLSFFISDAAAQDVDITIRTPAIQAIQARMAERFRGFLPVVVDVETGRHPQFDPWAHAASAARAFVTMKSTF